MRHTVMLRLVAFIKYLIKCVEFLFEPLMELAHPFPETVHYSFFTQRGKGIGRHRLD